MRRPRRYRISVDFLTQQAAAEFFEGMRDAGLLPCDTGLRKLDCLDAQSVTIFLARKETGPQGWLVAPKRALPEGE